MSKEEETKAENKWAIWVHGVKALVEYPTHSEALNAVKEWKSRGWEFVEVKGVN